MTLFNNNKIVEYKHNHNLIKLLNKRIDELKKRRKRKNKRKLLNKLEKRKKNLIDEIHWKTITDITSFNDIIFYGNINNHDIVKNSNNTYLNRDINDLKFYLFKERLIFKSLLKNKYVILVNEAFTTKTCSCCGSRYEICKSKTYICSKCNNTMDRDINAAKNILLKGIINL
jgi:transposase